MQPGAVLGNRFVLDAQVAAGGMGVVWRARDLAGDGIAAVKVLDAERRARHGDERFRREAVLLGSLDHPAIVRHLGHGEDGGRPWLAMEWLDGEDLAARLARAPLGLAEALAVVRAAAEGLAHAHARGVVHRDVKPANLFLCAGGGVKVVDFGIARQGDATLGLTATNALIGTAGYMAPEQARGERELDARADVFALGCVLYECISGEPAFSGAHVAAVLSKVVLDDAPRLSGVRADIPPVLDDLVARMMAKAPAGRPADAGEVAAALAALGPIDAVAPTGGVGPAALGTQEQRLVAVLLIQPEDAGGIASTVIELGARSEIEAVEAAIAPFGAALSRLASGALVATLGGTGSATDRAARAARCALAVAASLPGARLALATGLADTSGRFLVGPVIDRAAALLAAPGPGIRIDEVTADLLDPRFQVRGRSLVACHDDATELRLLLGRPTVFVGRERELTVLDATWAACRDEPAAQLVVVIAPPGGGKSRLRAELTARIDGTVLLARAEQLAASPFALARQLARHADPAGIPHGAEFLAELLGDPIAEPGPQLRAARADPLLMRDWIQRTFVAWLDAECRRRPVLLVLEDLHWGDAPSVSLIGAALASLADRPLCVLALARPELDEAFPQLWPGCPVTRIVLPPLGRRAAEALIRGALPAVDPATVTRLIAHADGNPFHLEELVRRVAEGHGAELPGTVLAMVQSRLEQLPAEQRRVLRVASVLGERFATAPLAELLGTDAGALARDLAALVRAEALVRDPAGHAFRHAVVQAAASSMLTDDDRRRAHARAGDWLEQAGDPSALVIAEHFERGGEPERAAPHLVRAAQQAFEGGQLAPARDLAGRAIGAGASGPLLGRALLLQGMASAFRMEYRSAAELAAAAVAALPAGSPSWITAQSGIASAAIDLGPIEPALRAADEVLGIPALPAPSTESGLGLFTFVTALLQRGAPGPALALYDRFSALRGRDLGFDGWWWQAEANLAAFRDRDPARLRRAFEQSVEAADVLGDGQLRGFALLTRILVLQDERRDAEAAALWPELRASCSAESLSALGWGMYLVARSLLRLGAVGDARALAAPLAGGPSHAGRALAGLVTGHARLLEGHLDDAERLAVDHGATSMFMIAHGGLIRCEVARRRGDDEAARVTAAAALAALGEVGTARDRAELEAFAATR